MSVRTSKSKGSRRKSGSRKTYQAKRYARSKIHKFRSNFEAKIQHEITEKGVPSEYEKLTLEYTQVRKYKPDFVLKGAEGKEIVIEAKGLFDSEDRRKHLDVRQQHPDLDIRFVFYSNQKLYKGAKSRYTDWCDKNGFKYAIKSIPDEWIEELGLDVKEKETKDE